MSLGLRLNKAVQEVMEMLSCLKIIWTA